MAERIFIRKLNDHQWQWRVLGSDNYWTEVAGAGDLEYMLESLEGISLPACLILPGTQTTVTRMPVDAKEKNHMAKLLPYEMEEMICEPIDDLHFSFSNIVDGHALVAYTKLDAIEEVLEELAPLGCDVQQIFPDFLFIARQDDSATLLVDNSLLLIRFADGRGLTIEEDLSQIILQKLSHEVPPPRTLNLVALDDDQLQRLYKALPKSWTGDAPPPVIKKPEIPVRKDDDFAGLEESLEENLDDSFDESLDETLEEPVSKDPASVDITQEHGDFWQWMDLAVMTSPLNYRRGKFSRKLPIERWWYLWKFPVYVAAASFLLAFGLTFGEYLSAKSEGKNIRKQIEQVYLKAVPNGRRGDEERRLETLLKGSGGDSDKASEPSNLMVLLSGISKAMEQHGDIKLNNFRYNGEQRELQVNLMVKGLDELTQFKELLAQKGLDTGSPRTSLQGDAYQASMKVTEKTL